MTPKRTIAAAIEALAAAENVTPLAFICGRLASAQNLTQLAKEIGFSRQNLATYASALAPDAKAEMKAARENGYQAMLEAAHGLIDALGAEPSREALAVVQAKISLIQWGAERQARSEFAPASQQVNFNIAGDAGRNFIDAMRNRCVRVDAKPAEPTLLEPGVDFTVEPAEEGGRKE